MIQENFDISKKVQWINTSDNLIRYYKDKKNIFFIFFILIISYIFAAISYIDLAPFVQHDSTGRTLYNNVRSERLVTIFGIRFDVFQHFLLKLVLISPATWLALICIRMHQINFTLETQYINKFAIAYLSKIHRLGTINSINKIDFLAFANVIKFPLGNHSANLDHGSILNKLESEITNRVIEPKNDFTNSLGNTVNANSTNESSEKNNNSHYFNKSRLDFRKNTTKYFFIFFILQILITIFVISFIFYVTVDIYNIYDHYAQMSSASIIASDGGFGKPVSLDDLISEALKDKYSDFNVILYKFFSKLIIIIPSIWIANIVNRNIYTNQLLEIEYAHKAYIIEYVDNIGEIGDGLGDKYLYAAYCDVVNFSILQKNNKQIKHPVHEFIQSFVDKFTKLYTKSFSKKSE